MRKVITYTQTQGDYAGESATCVPAAQADVAKFFPEVDSMTEEQYIQWIIDRDVLKYNPENVQVITIDDQHNPSR